MKLSALVAEVETLATEYPETRYASVNLRCYYHLGEAGPGVGCIVGQAAKRAGIGRHNVALAFEGDAVQWTKWLADDTIDLNVDTDLYKAGNWLSEIQTLQDEGKSWGAALELVGPFKEYLE